MRILHVLLSHKSLPPLKYGGTERVVWSLYQAQIAAGHEVKFLWRKAPTLPPDTIIYKKSEPLEKQIGTWADVVHFHFPFDGTLSVPYICTEHGNANEVRSYPTNTVFLSAKHATLHGAKCFVHNGLDWRDYGQPNLDAPKNYAHFLGKAKSTNKNLDGSIEVAHRAGVPLKVLGGHRLSLSKPIKFYPQRFVSFCGMVGGEKKSALIRDSKALVMPVRWHEPFGLMLIESLYLGCPVLGSPYGAFPEIINDPQIGLLSTDYSVLAEALASCQQFDRRACHARAVDYFGMTRMANDYQSCYERVIEGEALNPQQPCTLQSWIDPLAIGESAGK